MSMWIFKKAKCVFIVIVLYKIEQNASSTESSLWMYPQPSFADFIPNVTVSAGRDVSLSCAIENLGRYRVAWSHKERGTLISIQSRIIVRDSRFRVTDDNESIWYLHIRGVTEQDTGQYMCQINTTPMISQVGFLEVVVAPYIDEEETSSDIDVYEGKDAFMKCTARGSPRPDVKWRREDGMGISTGKEKETAYTIQGEYLNITKVSRLNMGVYLCIASNGIPPSLNKRITLRVRFPPMVWIPNQLVGASLGSEVTLDCNLESSPRPVVYWIKESGKMVLSGKNYNILTTTSGHYKLHMKIIIRNVQSDDFGSFTCVAKNTLGETTGTIRLYEIPHSSKKELFQLTNSPNAEEFDEKKEILKENSMTENSIHKGKGTNTIVPHDSDDKSSSSSSWKYDSPFFMVSTLMAVFFLFKSMINESHNTNNIKL